MDPRGDEIPLPGEPPPSRPSACRPPGSTPTLRDEAMFRGYTVVEPATVISTHLTEIIKDNIAELLSYAETRKLLDELPKEHQKLVDDIVPAQISYGGVQRVLQNLLAERVSIRDLPAILEAIAEIAGQGRSIPSITEHVRTRLARQICAMHATPTASRRSSRSRRSGSRPSPSPSSAGRRPPARHAAVQAAGLRAAPAQRVRAPGDERRDAGAGDLPALRPFVRSIIERFRPSAAVMSQSEVHPRARIKTVGQI